MCRISASIRCGVQGSAAMQLATYNSTVDSMLSRKLNVAIPQYSFSEEG